MAGQGILTFASEALKLVYGDLHMQLRDKTPALDFIKASSSNITRNGKEVVFDTHIGRNQGIGARNVREKLPTAGAQKYKQAHLYLKNLYGSIEVDGQLFEQAAEDYQAFINVVDNEIKGLRRDLAVDMNRQIYGDGSGTLAVVAEAATASTTVEFDSVHYVDYGMIVDVLDASSSFAQLHNEVEVVAIDTAIIIILLTIVSILILGIGLWFALQGLFGWLNVNDDSLWSGLLSGAITVLSGVLLFRVVAVAITWVFADDIIDAVEDRHYPRQGMVRRDARRHGISLGGRRRRRPAP
jgi:hypothetical protein